MKSGKEKIKLLFVCTGNSCRSQMAEGWARHLKDDCIDAYSAGIRPIGVNPRAVKVMADAGVDIKEQYSKSIDDLAGLEFNYVVTLCDNARQNCSVFPAATKLIHKSIEDPYFAKGTEKQIMEVFRKTRDQIKAFVETLPESLEQDIG
jgi:arsenate reductase